MRIPTTTASPRFYVATSESHAFSSWDSRAEAEASFRRLAHHHPDDARRVIGICETGPSGRTVHVLKNSS